MFLKKYETNKWIIHLKTPKNTKKNDDLFRISRFYSFICEDTRMLDGV